MTPKGNAGSSLAVSSAFVIASGSQLARGGGEAAVVLRRERSGGSACESRPRSPPGATPGQGWVVNLKIHQKG